MGIKVVIHYFFFLKTFDRVYNGSNANHSEMGVDDGVGSLILVVASTSSIVIVYAKLD
jgi:hypothetical protein